MAESGNPAEGALPHRLLALYTSMVRVRAFEEKALAAAKEGLLMGALHPSIGQEAVAAGVCGNLRPDDVLLSTHRGHGHTLVKGSAPAAMMCELLGREAGSCHGKGGSMHLADFSVGMLGANGVVGANILIAAGAAHAIRLTGGDRVVACIFGDGAINRGPFLEGLNWARIFDLPVLFVCEDNGYAATTRTATMSAGSGPAARAESLAIPACEIDGNDVEAVDRTTRDLVAQVRAGGGPRLLWAKTYRLMGHTSSDPAAYRPAEEVEAAWKNDPILRCRNRLLALDCDEKALAEIERAAGAEMAECLNEARSAPWPDVSLAYEDVQDVGAPDRGVG